MFKLPLHSSDAAAQRSRATSLFLLIQNSGTCSGRRPFLPSSHLVQLQRHGDPGRTIDDQIDSYEKADNPKSRDWPLREEQDS